MAEHKDEQHRLTDGVSASAIRTFLEDLKREFPESYADMTTEDACQQLVVPRTKERNYAYVEQLRRESPAEVGKATVFVSHAWRYKVTDVLGTLLEFAEEQEEEQEGESTAIATTYFWFDLFMNNQNVNVTANLPQDWWSTTFKESIASIGRVLLVLMPWHDPVPLTRAWCLWEIFCGISDGVDVTIRLPRSQDKELVRSILRHHTAVTNTLVRVDAERAQARNPRDKEMIFGAIQSWAGGFGKVNEAIKDQLRVWCLAKAVAAVEDKRSRDQKATAAFAGLCAKVGMVLWQFDEVDKAIAYYQEALAIRLETDGPRSEEVALLHGNLASAFQAKGDSDKAIEYHKSALPMLGLEDKAKTYNNIGIAYLTKGDYDKAIEWHKKASNANFGFFGLPHPIQANSLGNVANAYYRKKEYRKAAEYHEKALGICLVVFGKKHPRTADTYCNLGTTYHTLGNYDSAIESYTNALPATVQTLGPKHRYTAETHHFLGAVYRDKGDLENARESFERALVIRAEALGEAHKETGFSAQELGLVHEQRGDMMQAAQFLERAVAALSEALGSEHTSTEKARHALQRVHAAQAPDAEKGDKCAVVDPALVELQGEGNEEDARGGGGEGETANAAHVKLEGRNEDKKRSSCICSLL